MDPGDTLLVETQADWLAPDALVVGYLTVTLRQIAFRSLVPNSARAILVDIGRVRGVALASVAAVTPRSVAITVDDGRTLAFLVADPATVARAVEQARIALGTRTAYR